MTIVFDKTSTLTGTDDQGGYSNANFRSFLPAALLASATGNQVRITFRFGTSNADSGSVVDSCFIGQSGTGANFTGDQVRVTFNTGSNGFSATGVASQEITSDFVTLAQTFDNTHAYTVAWHLVTAFNPGNASSATVTSAILYYQASAADSSGSTTPAGLGTNTDLLDFL